MFIKKGIIGLCVASLLFMTAGCGQKEYYNAMQAQNVTIQKLNNHEIEVEQQADQTHEEHMLLLINNSMNACSKTPGKMDDVLVPMLIMNMENQWMLGKVLSGKNGNHMMALQKIKAPETFGEGVQKSTGAILGIGAIWAGISQSNNLKDVALGGMAAAGTHNYVSGKGNTLTNDSYKTGSQNTVQGNNNAITAGNVDVGSENTDNCADGNCDGGEVGTQGEASTGVDQCLQNPPAGISSNGYPLYKPGCSCKSHFIDKKC